MPVVDENQIRIDGKLYWTRDRVRQFLASRPLERTIVGEQTSASNPLASETNWDDLRDGIGVEIAELPQDQHRVWFSTAQLRFKGRIILPRRSVLTAAGPATDIHVLIDFDNTVYATYGTAVHAYNNSTDSWGSSVRTLLNNATDAAVGILYPSDTATETMVIATGSEVDYTTNGSSWSRDTTDIKWLIFHGDLLWGMDNAGQLYFTDDLSAGWTADARLQLPAGYATGLNVGVGSDEKEHIFAITKAGVRVHDRENRRFEVTKLNYPFHPDGGKGHVVWRDFLAVSAGNAVYAYQPDGRPGIVTVIGPDRDHGLPSDKRGAIARLLGSHNELLALLDASVAEGVSALETRVSRGVRFHHGVTFPAQTGYSLILGWNQRGWQVNWQSAATARPISAGLVSSAYSTYRLWWAANRRVYHQTLPVDVINPLNVTGSEYESSAEIEFPWVDMGIRNQRKLALSVIAETVNPTTSETVLIEYATDYVETYTALDTKDETGETEYLLPNTADPDGVPFRAWKFRVTLARGSTVTNTPQLVKLTLVWRPRVDVQYGVEADLMVDDESPDGLPPIEQHRDLRLVASSHGTGKLLPVEWTASDKPLYMDMLDMQTVQESGYAHNGDVRVVLAEPRHTELHEER